MLLYEIAGRKQMIRGLVPIVLIWPGGACDQIRKIFGFLVSLMFATLVLPAFSQEGTAVTGDQTFRIPHEDSLAQH